MRFVRWTIRLALFLFLVAFAARNTDPVTLRFFLDRSWEVPLVLLLAAAFAAGAVGGALAVLGPWLRLRRERARLRSAAGAAPERPAPPSEG